MGNQLTTLINNTTTKSIDHIISSWRYQGKALTRERIAFDDFIDLHLKFFKDLIRLHDAYDKLLGKYSRVLSDVIESRDAVEVVLRNMELLQVAIGEIHGRAINLKEKTQMNNAINKFMTNLSNDLKTLKSEWPSLHVNLQAELVDKVEGDNLVEFNHGERLACRHTFTRYGGDRWFPRRYVDVLAMELFVIKGKQHVAIAEKAAVIKLWDLSTNERVAKLSGHEGKINALASYMMNDGESMLASGSSDKTIKLWDPIKTTNYYSFSDLPSGITSLATYENRGKKILVSGSDCGIIKLIDLDDYSTIKILQKNGSRSVVFHIYHRNNELYLASASGGYSDGVKVWNLNDFKKDYIDDSDHIVSLTTVLYDDELVLACGRSNGTIAIYSLSNLSRKYWKEVSKNHTIYSLEAIRYKGKVCLICMGTRDKYEFDMKIWNVQNRRVMASLDTDSIVTKIKAFMHDGKACLLTLEEDGLKLWTE